MLGGGHILLRSPSVFLSSVAHPELSPASQVLDGKMKTGHRGVGGTFARPSTAGEQGLRDSVLVGGHILLRIPSGFSCILSAVAHPEIALVS